jgi:hypothetical protein
MFHSCIEAGFYIHYLKKYAYMFSYKTKLFVIYSISIYYIYDS